MASVLVRCAALYTAAWGRSSISKLWRRGGYSNAWRSSTRP